MSNPSPTVVLKGFLGGKDSKIKLPKTDRGMFCIYLAIIMFKRYYETAPYMYSISKGKVTDEHRKEVEYYNNYSQELEYAFINYVCSVKKIARLGENGYSTWIKEMTKSFEEHTTLYSEAAIKLRDSMIQVSKRKE